MTRLLASVTGPEEAAIALAGGADIIDLKDPARGALGAVAPEAIRETVAHVAGRVPVSAVTGDLPMQPGPVAAAAEAAIAAGAQIVKAGIFPGGDPAACLRALAPLAGRARLVAVLFADRAPDLSLLPLIAEAGFAGAMLDTADKHGADKHGADKHGADKRAGDKGRGGLLAHMDLPRLRRFVAACRAQGLFAGLAGALEAPDVPRLLVLQPEVLGFRGALCAGGRTGRIDPAAVEAIRALIPREAAGVQSAGVDTHTLAAQGYAQDPAGDPTRTDRVFLRDWVLPVRIGAYAREHAAPQRVRFSVEATVLRAAAATRDMRDVFSYDIISDGIRMLTEGQHVELAETLAERIAALVLEHPRVMRVQVCVEKLDVGTGTVGVAIERRRDDPAPPAARIFGGAP